MPKLGKIHTLLHPAAGTWGFPDAVFLVVFGAWFFAPLASWLFQKPDPNAYACAGPGFVDFGCTGGWKALVANVGSWAFSLFLFCVFLVALLRLINRRKNRRNGQPNGLSHKK